MTDFIARHRDTYGVEPICKVLQIAPSAYWRHAAEQRNPTFRCTRSIRDDELIPEIRRVWEAWLRAPNMNCSFNLVLNIGATMKLMKWEARSMHAS